MKLPIIAIFFAWCCLAFFVLLTILYIIPNSRAKGFDDGMITSMSYFVAVSSHDAEGMAISRKKLWENCTSEGRDWYFLNENWDKWAHVVDSSFQVNNKYESTP
jgi:hypothetical protein